MVVFNFVNFQDRALTNAKHDMYPPSPISFTEAHPFRLSLTVCCFRFVSTLSPERECDLQNNWDTHFRLEVVEELSVKRKQYPSVHQNKLTKVKFLKLSPRFEFHRRAMAATVYSKNAPSLSCPRGVHRARAAAPALTGVHFHATTARSSSTFHASIQ